MKARRIIAREFLILIGVIVLSAIFFGIIYLSKEYFDGRHFQLVSAIDINNKKIDSLQNIKLTIIPLPKWHPPSEYKTVLPPLPKGVKLIVDYKQFSNSPDVKNNLEDFARARKNLIELHNKLVEFNFSRYDNFYDDFIPSLNKEMLLKIYNGITGQTNDFVPISGIPNKFSDFILSIGIDTTTFKLIENQKANGIETEIENQKLKINESKKELSKLNRSWFYNTDVKEIGAIVFYILLILVYPIRGLIVMTKWSVKTLQKK